MSRRTKKRLEKILLNEKIVGRSKAARQYKKGGKWVSATSTVSSLGMAAATPAVAGAAGLGSAAATGTIALAAAFPIGTIIVAVPALIGLGFGAARAAKKKNAKYLTKDQGELAKMIKKYKKKKSTWRQEKARELLKAYSGHLDKGKEKTWLPHDGNKRKRSKKRWKANKAEMEMRMMAVYMAEYHTTPKKAYSKSEKAKSQKLIQSIKTKQLASLDPKTSPLSISSQGKVMLDRVMMQKQAARMLQRPTEYSDMIQMKDARGPQSVLTTLKQASSSGITLPPGYQRELQKAANLGMALKSAGIEPQRVETEKDGSKTKYFVVGGIVIVLSVAGAYMYKKSAEAQA